jgi:hypothetical protein
MLPGDVVHVQRVRHPLTRAPEQVIEDTFDDGAAGTGTPAAQAAEAAHPVLRRWIVEQGPGATIHAEGGTVAITASRGAHAFLDLRVPQRPSQLWPEYMLPRGLVQDVYDERLDWEANVFVMAPFMVMLDTRPLLVQATPFGLHLTFPDPDGRLTEQHIEMPSIPAGARHRYTLERMDGLIRLRIDGEGKWVQPESGPLGLVRFGETRPGELHAGTLALDSVRYARRYVPGNGA